MARRLYGLAPHRAEPVSNWTNALSGPGTGLRADRARPNFLDGFDRLVAFDAETTGKRTPDAEFIRKQPFAWRAPGIIIEVGFVEMLREGDALAFALRFQGRKRVHNADEIMAEIVAKRLVEHLERAGFVVMKRPTDVGAAALGRGFEG